MAFGENKPISVGPLGVFGVMSQRMKIEDGQNIRARQGAAGVTGGGNAEHFDDVPPYRESGLRKEVPVDFLIHCVLNLRHKLCQSTDSPHSRQTIFVLRSPS